MTCHIYLQLSEVWFLNGVDMERTADFWYLILATQREGNRLLAEALRPLELTPAQMEVLAVLSLQAPLPLIALGQRLVCESGSPSRLVNGLVRVGWVRREDSPLDRRGVLLSLTDAGEALAVRAEAVLAEFQAELAQLLPETSVEELARGLWRLVAHLPGGRALRLRAGPGSRRSSPPEPRG